MRNILGNLFSSSPGAGFISKILSIEFVLMIVGEEFVTFRDKAHIFTIRIRKRGHFSPFHN